MLQWKRMLLWGGLLFITLWLSFLDSHSIFRRVSWHLELRNLSSRNQELQLEIESLERALTISQADAVVERVAREQYGMRRPGETVYRVSPSP